MSDPFIGEIKLFALNYAPRGWAFCNGQTLPILQNQALFSILGYTYGGSQNNFLLPDLRGRTPNGFNDSHPLGLPIGQRNTTLTVGNLPLHTHLMMANTAEANQRTPAGNSLAAPVSQPIYGAPDINNVMLTTEVGNAGGSQPFNNQQPFLVLNFCIALVGIYPSRN